MSRCRSDVWGKVLLLTATLLLVAPWMMHTVMHHARHHIHGHGGFGGGGGGGMEGPGAADRHLRGGREMNPRHRNTEFGRHSNEAKEDSPSTTSASSSAPAAPEMPPMFHPEFHRLVAMLAILCVGSSFLAPSRLRLRLGLVVMVSLISIFPLPLLTLARHADARVGYCKAVATRHIPTYMIMSVSIGPFEAMSVVRTPSIKTVDTEVETECNMAVEQRVKFIGSALWGIFMVLFLAASGMTMSDAKQFRQERQQHGGDAKSIEDGTGLQTGTVVVALDSIGTSCIADQTHAEEEEDSSSLMQTSPVQPCARQNTLPYITE